MRNDQPVLLDRKVLRLSAWTSLVARTVRFPYKSGPDEYHSLRQADYVSVLAVTPEGKVALVRQYRPAMERVTLELPGGLLEEGGSPEETAIRELAEETGLSALATPQLLGCLSPDTGRLENRLWCFFARACPVTAASWVPEAGVEPSFVYPRELRELLLKGQLENALHVALIGLAVMREVIAWDR